jgi:hypothetical protein
MKLPIFFAPNESVEKVILPSQCDVLEGLLAPSQHEILAYRTSWKVVFSFTQRLQSRLAFSATYD